MNLINAKTISVRMSTLMTDSAGVDSPCERALIAGVDQANAITREIKATLIVLLSTSFIFP